MITGGDDSDVGLLQNQNSGMSDLVQQSNSLMDRNMDGVPKRAKNSRKASTAANETANLHEQDVFILDDTILERFSFLFKSAATFDNSVSKEWIVNSRMHFFVLNVALEFQYTSLLHISSRIFLTGSIDGTYA